MTCSIRSRILATSALAGMTLWQGAAAVAAQDAFGIHTDEPGVYSIVVADGEVVEGTQIGIYVEKGEATIDVQEGGTVRGNSAADGLDTLPGAGITISVPDVSVTNAGTISGAGAGITSIYTYNPTLDALEGLAVGTSVTNSGTIAGEANDGVRLIGGGSVTNSGSITGSGAAGADGISIFEFAVTGQDPATYSASVTNTATGTITGDRYGLLMNGGGTLDNAGEIYGDRGGVVAQGFVGGIGSPMASVTNSGSIGANGANGEGEGVFFGGTLASATLTNSGTITSDAFVGVFQASSGELTVTNTATGTITGGTSGIYSGPGGPLIVDNAGIIRGNGSADGLDAAPDAGITITTAGSSVTNSGTITGAGLGITTAYYYSPSLDELVGLAVGTSVTNSGTIAGESNDGVRLIGGGSVTNSGSITGSGGPGADGISIFEFTVTGQDPATYSASVTNTATGTITGDRYGLFMNGGGTLDNAGEIYGDRGGVVAQGFVGGIGSPVASVTNSGSIGANGANGEGEGVFFGGTLASATLTNSGSITSDAYVGVYQGSSGELTVTNTATGTITGGTSGIYSGYAGSLIVDNAGIIRGNGTADGLDTVPDAGITIATANSSVTNSGTISGAGAGITSVYFYNPTLDALEGLAVGTSVTNSGTIAGESNDGVRLIGGGSVTNSGSITGSGAAGADGISIFEFAVTGQDPATYSASVTNTATGTITGDRYGLLMNGGGTLDNAGEIYGDRGGVVVQGFVGGIGSPVATVTNSGSIGANGANGEGEGVYFGGTLASATLTNSGTITSDAFVGVYQASSAALEVLNLAGGTIEGGTNGVESAGSGSITVRNAGTIIGNDGAAIASTTQTTIFNAGTLTGSGDTAILLGAFNDTVTLRNGSAITGAIDTGAGTDTLRLNGDILELTSAQVVGETRNVENLRVDAGYWQTEGFLGSFDSVAIASGATFQLNEIQLNGDPAAPLVSGPIANEGALVINLNNTRLGFPNTISTTGSGSLTVTGSGFLQVTNAALGHTGGTTISSGTLFLQGSHGGDIVVEEGGTFFIGGFGDDFGDFTGNLVNDGTFTFNRPDDYDFVGDFSGTGLFNKFGEGTLTFLGDYTFSGLTQIEQGSVAFAGSLSSDTRIALSEGASVDFSQVTGGVQEIAELSGPSGLLQLGATTLVINQTTSTTFGGALTGSGEFILQGTGALNLTGDGSGFTGTGTVSGGTLFINGNYANTVVTVETGGVLGGTGQVGDTTLNGGTLAPGNSIGTVNIAGDLVLDSTSLFEVEVNAAGGADLVAVSGTATLGGAGVAVLAENGFYAPVTQYTILTAEDGVSGTFGPATTNFAFLDPVLGYSANAVTLQLVRNNLEFSGFGQTPNEVAIANLIETLGFGNDVYDQVLMLSDAQVSPSFATLTGEVYPTFSSQAIERAEMVRRQTEAAMTGGQGAFVWATGLMNGVGNGDLGGENYGVAGGLGYGAGNLSLAVGLGTMGQAGQNSATDDNSADFVIGRVAYGGSTGLVVSAGAQLGWIDSEFQRFTALGAISQRLNSAGKGDYVQLFGELGYAVPLGGLTLKPYAGISHVSLDLDGWNEAGGSTALAVGPIERDVTFASFGLQLSADAGGVRPFANAAYRRAWGDTAGLANVRIGGSAASAVISGAGVARSGAELGAGVSVPVGPVEVQVGYTGMVSSEFDSHGANVGLRLSF